MLDDFLEKGFRSKKLRGLDFDEVEVLLSDTHRGGHVRVL